MKHYAEQLLLFPEWEEKHKDEILSKNIELINLKLGLPTNNNLIGIADKRIVHIWETNFRHVTGIEEL